MKSSKADLHVKAELGGQPKLLPVIKDFVNANDSDEDRKWKGGLSSWRQDGRTTDTMDGHKPIKRGEQRESKLGRAIEKERGHEPIIMIGTFTLHSIMRIDSRGLWQRFRGLAKWIQRKMSSTLNIWNFEVILWMVYKYSNKELCVLLSLRKNQHNSLIPHDGMAMICSLWVSNQQL